MSETTTPARFNPHTQKRVRNSSLAKRAGNKRTWGGNNSHLVGMLPGLKQIFKKRQYIHVLLSGPKYTPPKNNNKD